MISLVSGIVNKKDSSSVEVLVGGIGYRVLVHERVRAEVEEGEEEVFFTYLQVAEGVMDLYGFLAREEVEVFKLLLGVSGVGPKTALQIVGSGGPEGIVKAISEADVGFFERVKGIGKKGAQRIIVDLKAKIGGWGEIDFDGGGKEQGELGEGLRSLGFSRAEIEAVSGKIPGECKSIEQKISWCLRELGGGSE